MLHTTGMGKMRLILFAIIPPPIIILHLGEAKYHTLGRQPGWMTCRAADARQIAAWGCAMMRRIPRLDETRTQPSGSAARLLVPADPANLFEGSKQPAARCITASGAKNSTGCPPCHPCTWPRASAPTCFIHNQHHPHPTAKVPSHQNPPSQTQARFRVTRGSSRDPASHVPQHSSIVCAERH